MFLGTRRIDDLLTWTVTTHTFATGALTDADAVPSYRVYEAETGTAILTGSMAKLDDSNTTGHYSEEITLSAANGFEAGKSYNIYITAAVSSVTGGAVRHFYVEAVPATAAALTTVSGLVDDLETRLTATRAGYLDNLSAGAVALASGVTLAAATHTGAVIPTVTDVTTKTGYSLSAAGVQAIWDALTSALTAVGSIGKLLVDRIDAAITSRMATFAYTTPLDAAGVRTAVGLASANLDTQLGDLPTNAELATSQAAADDAVLAAIAALNNLSSAGAQAAAAAALAAYDAATGADVAAVTAPSAANVADAVWDEALAGHLTSGSTGEALDGSGSGGGGSSAADVWTYATRTLTAAAVAGPGTELDGGDITARRGDSFSVSLTGLGNISARTKLWFTAKRRTGQTDAQAEIQVIEATGLAVIAGSAATAGNGSLTVTNATTGAATLALAAVETAKMPPGDMLHWDIQMATAAGVTTLAVGTLTFSADVTLATA